MPKHREDFMQGSPEGRPLDIGPWTVPRNQNVAGKVRRQRHLPVDGPQHVPAASECRLVLTFPASRGLVFQGNCLRPPLNSTMMNPSGQPPVSHGDPTTAMMGMMSHHAGMSVGAMQAVQQPQHPQQHFSPPGAAGVRCCAGCGVKIMDRFLLLALDRYWHNGCLKCSCCQATLADIGSSCFTKAGMILCKSDYIRLFGNSGACSACGQMIPASEFVMRAQGNVYHLKCFACVKCHNQLVPGDRFNLVNGSVICEQDCIKMLKGTVSPAGVRKTKMRVNSAIKV